MFSLEECNQKKDLENNSNFELLSNSFNHENENNLGDRSFSPPFDSCENLESFNFYYNEKYYGSTNNFSLEKKENNNDEIKDEEKKDSNNNDEKKLE